MEDSEYQCASRKEELWQEINKAINSYLTVQKQNESWTSAWFHSSMTVFLGDHAEAVSKLFDLHLLDTRIPLIQTFFRGVLTLVVFSTFMPAELDAALTQSNASYGCGILALRHS